MRRIVFGAGRVTHIPAAPPVKFPERKEAHYASLVSCNCEKRSSNCMGVILAALAISKVAAQAPIAQIQAEGVRVALEIANAKLAAIGARTRFSQVD